MRLVATFGKPDRPIHLLDIGDGTHVELFAPLPNSTDPELQEAPYRHLALCVDDVAGAIELVRAAGRPITVEPKVVNLAGRKATIAFFDGPGGESIEFFHQEQ